MWNLTFCCFYAWNNWVTSFPNTWFPPFLFEDYYLAYLWKHWLIFYSTQSNVAQSVAVVVLSQRLLVLSQTGKVLSCFCCTHEIYFLIFFCSLQQVFFRRCIFYLRADHFAVLQCKLCLKTIYSLSDSLNKYIWP